MCAYTLYKHILYMVVNEILMSGSSSVTADQTVPQFGPQQMEIRSMSRSLTPRAAFGPLTPDWDDWECHGEIERVG